MLSGVQCPNCESKHVKEIHRERGTRITLISCRCQGCKKMMHITLRTKK